MLRSECACVSAGGREAGREIVRRRSWKPDAYEGEQRLKQLRERRLKTNDAPAGQHWVKKQKERVNKSFQLLKIKRDKTWYVFIIHRLLWGHFSIIILFLAFMGILQVNFHCPQSVKEVKFYFFPLFIVIHYLSIYCCYFCFT